MSAHVVPVKTYVVVFLALIALTALTTGVAFIDLGAHAPHLLPHRIADNLNTVAALLIAVCKMLLVILFFMHVRYSSGLTRIVIAAAFFWLAILLVLTMNDFRTRRWTPSPSGWQSSQRCICHPKQA